MKKIDLKSIKSDSFGKLNDESMKRVVGGGYTGSTVTIDIQTTTSSSSSTTCSTVSNDGVDTDVKD